MEKDKESHGSEKGYKLLSLVEEGRDVTVRDDLYDFLWVLDAVKLCRKKGFRFRLIDSGRLDCLQLERLAGEGIDFYTSDEVKRSVQDLTVIKKSLRRRKNFIAFFCNGDLKTEKETDFLSYSDYLELARNGIYLYLTNREKERDFSGFSELARQCKKHRSWLVYYHHGPLDPSIMELSKSGAWIHLSDESINEAKDLDIVLNIIKSARSSRANLVLYLEKGLELSYLKDIHKAGAFVLFKSPLFENDSPFKPLAEKAGKRKLDVRAYYLYSKFML